MGQSAYLKPVMKSWFSQPGSNLSLVKDAIRRRFRPQGPKIIVSTHHKALTVLFSRILQTYKRLAGGQFSRGLGHEIDWGASLILDHHSQVDHHRIPHYQGIHIVRDPRDILVSSVHYHQKSEEPWLHQSYPEFDGHSYAEMIRELGTMEEKLLFELDNAAGRIIEHMGSWDRSHPHIAEFRYEDLIASDRDRVFKGGLKTAGFDSLDIRLLGRLFHNFSLGGPWMPSGHIRNPTPGQYKAVWTPAVEERFHQKFPGLLESLGYETA